MTAKQTALVSPIYLLTMNIVQKYTIKLTSSQQLVDTETYTHKLAHRTSSLPIVADAALPPGD